MWFRLSTYLELSCRPDSQALSISDLGNATRKYLVSNFEFSSILNDPACCVLWRTVVGLAFTTLVPINFSLPRYKFLIRDPVGFLTSSVTFFDIEHQGFQKSANFEISPPAALNSALHGYLKSRQVL